MNALTMQQTGGKLTEQISAELLNSFVSYLDTSKRTVETYTCSLRQFFKWLTANEIRQPQRADILEYKSSLMARGLKPSTVQSYITAVKLFFSWAEQEGFYPNIAQHIKGVKIDKSHKKDYLTKEQAKEILGNIEQHNIKGKRDYAIMALMLTTGMRTVEVVRADISDLRTLGNKTVLYVWGKGRTDKTDFVIIEPETEKAIRAYLKARGNAKANEPLFVSTSNNNCGKSLTTRTIRGIVKEILRNAGYDSDRLTAHSLRHTSVTLSLLAGKDITEAQQFARHSSIDTTQIYNHALQKAQNSCSRAIADAIFY